jgi:hypothetical protein
VAHELLAMVRQDQDERSIQRTLAAQVVEKPAELRVGEGDLLAVETDQIGDVGRREPGAHAAQLPDVRGRT